MKPIYFIIPAGGVGSRMKADTPKQYLLLDNETILNHTVTTFLSSTKIRRGVVGIAKDDRYFLSSVTESLCADDRLLQAEGGKTRAETVFNGLLKLKSNESEADLESAWVLVHDAARPGLSVAELDNFIDEVLKDHPPYGGIMALPAQDTIKSVNQRGEIDATLDRERIWLAQTPQMIPFTLLYNSLERALRLEINVTDEASVLEYNGYFPKVYRGYTHNFKITYPDDLELMRLHFMAKKGELKSEN